MPNPYTPRNGDDLHNYNAYRYLLALKKALQPPEPVSSPSEKNRKRVEHALSFLESVKEDHYDPSYSYGNLYSIAQQDLDAYTPQENEDPRIIALIEAMFLNDNFALESTYSLIKEVLVTNNQATSEAEHGITQRLNEGSNRSGNTYNPQAMETLGSKLYGVMGPTFAPQHTTSLPSIRHFNYQNEDSPTEIRMGTQGKYKMWGPEVSHLFKTWLQIRNKKDPGPNGISHIYFNNLGRDRSSIEGNREKNLTNELESLNDEEGIAVITLPADKGLFSSKDILSTATYDIKGAFTKQVVALMSGQPSDIEVKDIHIPDKIKKIIYKDENEAEVLERLLSKSYEAMGLKDLGEDQPLTKEQMQAVYFHFLKFELTNYILEETKPKSFNISCKDGIDRAGSASLFYNLMKSIEVGKPMTQAEFETNLHGPATLVKGRGMNKHRERVWSAVNQYVEANYNQLDTNENARWIIQWRDINAPSKRQNEIFEKRSQAILDSIQGDDDVTITVRGFITDCIELSKDNHYSKRFLMDMIYEAKSVAVAARQPTGEESVKNALAHMESRIKAYPEEIKELSFMEKVGRFFQNIANAIFKTPAYQSTKEKFTDKSSASFKEFKERAHRLEHPENMSPEVEINPGNELNH
ncbi:hypothetical protein [Legionella sp. W05-934-2]|uniref:hypothetical protein n=1 Tax=Legionella sp. W05-934-2 TaxID=1198649 RepID=UPI0034629C1A